MKVTLRAYNTFDGDRIHNAVTLRKCKLKEELMFEFNENLKKKFH